MTNRALTNLEGGDEIIAINRARAVTTLGEIFRGRKSFVEAEARYGQAISLIEQWSGPNRGELVSPLLGLARLLIQQRDYGAAEALARRATNVINENSPGSVLWAEPAVVWGSALAN